MKAINTIFILLFLCLGLNAQLQSKKQGVLFIGAGVNIGNHIGYNSYVAYQLPKKSFSVQLGGDYVSVNAHSAPSNYRGWGDDKKITSINFLIGHLVPIRRKGDYSRVNIKLGVGYAKYKIPINWRRSFWGLFYSHDIEILHQFELIIEPTYEMPFLEKYTGMSFSPYLRLGKNTAIYGFKIDFLFGRLY